MFLKINYTNDKEKEDIILNNKDLFLIEISETLSEKFLIFSDKRYISISEEYENKISILTEQNNQQEEIIASLTYELMMLQEPMASSTLINNHSPKYNLIKSWFNKGYWNEDMLLNAVEKHYITEEEMNEIIGN